MKVLFEFTRVLHVNVDAYQLICSVSMIFSGLTIILLYDTLASQLDIGKKTSIFASLAVLFSYEYWRYSYEAEVYMISLFLIILAFRFFMVTRQATDYKHIIGLSILCALSTLLYKPNFIPLFIVFPLIYLYFGKIKHLILFYTIGAVAILGCFGLVYAFISYPSSYVHFLFGGTNTPIGQAYMSLFVVASNIISVLWLFSSDQAVAFISDKFPHKIIDEEVFLAKQVDGLEVFFWICLSILITLFIVLIIRALTKKLVLTPYQKKATGIVVIWLVFYSIFLLMLDPSSNEPWLMVQIPIIVLLSILFVKPLKSFKLWLPYTLLFVLFFNNAVGGMWLLKSTKYDYNRVKSEWLRVHAQPKDIIMSYGPISFIRYLRYSTRAEVINIEEDPEWAYSILRDGNKSGYIYLTQDVIETPDPFKYRSGNIVKKFNKELHSADVHLDTISDHGFRTYQIKSLR